jgi:hypothetical protein
MKPTAPTPDNSTPKAILPTSPTLFDLLGRIEYDLANLTVQREQLRAQIAKALADAQPKAVA